METEEGNCWFECSIFGGREFTGIDAIAWAKKAESLGAGDARAAEKVGWRVARAAVIVLTVLALPVFAWSRELAGGLTADPAVQEATHLYLRLNMVSQPFMGLALCLGGGLQGAGDTRGTMKIVRNMGCIHMTRGFVSRKTNRNK